MSPQKRALFFTYHFPHPDKTGSFRPWVEATIMKKLGLDVTVITSGVDYITGENDIGQSLFKKELIDGISVIKVRTLSRYRDRRFKRLINYLLYAVMSFFAALAERRPDVVFIGTTSYFVTFTFYIYRLLKARHVKFIVDERDLFVESSITLGAARRGVASKMFMMWSNFFRKRADSVFTVSESMKKALVDRGLDESKIEMVPSVDIELMKNGCARNNVAPNFFKERKEYLVMYTGSFGMANDVMNILRAAERIKESNKNIGFVLVGGGEKQDFYKNYVMERRIDNTVILPPQTRNRVRMILTEADICVHALKKDKFWNMALSSKIFDYLLCKKPVIFCGGGEIKNIIETSGAGLSVEAENPQALASKIEELCCDKSRLAQMGQKGYDFVNMKYSQESIYNSFRKRLSSAAR